MDKLKVFTAFSGYDSQCMALERLKENFPEFDYELVGWAEIDKPAIASHNAVFPQWADRNYGDISKIDWSQVPDFDLFTYSSPCQDFSICGTQKGGFEGTQTRSSLLWECQRTIEEKRPKFLLLENVKALYEDHIFKPLLFAWKKTVDDYGYVSDIRVLNSSDYDIPQGRERVFMVSIRKDLNEPMYIWPKEMTKTREITDFLNKKVSEEYYADDKDFPKFYDLLVNAGEWFDETTKENKHLVKQGERVIKRRRYTIGENENKTEGALF
jgi:DNA (cytosine-5)-methyltransferase 1